LSQFSIRFEDPETGLLEHVSIGRGHEHKSIERALRLVFEFRDQLIQRALQISARPTRTTLELSQIVWIGNAQREGTNLTKRLHSDTGYRR